MIPALPSVRAALASRMPPVWAWIVVAILGLLGIWTLPATRGLAVFAFTMVALYLLPGVVLVRLLAGRAELTPGWRMAWGGLLGICVVGVSITVASILDIRLDAWFWRSYAALAALAFGIELFLNRNGVLITLQRVWRPSSTQVILGLGIAAACVSKLGAVALRLTPPLHDPASHALMAKLIVAAGHIPWFQLPFRANTFFYPPGFSSLVATTHVFSGVEIPRLVLYWTNLSVVLTALIGYVLISRATRSRGAGLWAFGLLAFLSLMPTGEFYLAGKNASVVSNVTFLGAILALLQLVRFPTRVSVFLAAALVAETFLLHYEKLFFLTLFGVVLLLVLPFKRKEIVWRQVFVTLVATAGLALALMAPWLYRVKWAVDVAKAQAITLVPGAPSPHLGAPLTWDSVATAFRNYWDLTSHFTDPSIVWLALLAPLAIVFAGTLEVAALLLFAALMPFFHPAIVEPFGISMASLSYDRIAVHFAYLPVCLAAALGLWGLWAILSRGLPRLATRVARPLLLALTALLLVYGGVSHFGLHRRVAAEPVVDPFDLEAFTWINRHLDDRRAFLFPVQNPDHQNRRYFVGEAALYMPLYTNHDVVCHFLRIETPQIEAEYRQYEAMLASSEPGLWASRHFFYTRRDREYYAPVTQWLETLPPGRVQERYRNEQVQVFEIIPAHHADKSL
ncbi:hypothetical protein D3C72_110690 [compost metagenome]